MPSMDPKRINVPSCPKAFESGIYSYTITKPNKYKNVIEIVFPINGRISEA